MCPPKACCIDEIGSLWTDEQLISCLKTIQSRSPGASLPCNVVADINPYLHEPSNLPEGIWYVVYSKDPKQTQVGFWKAKGDPCQIYSNSSFIGWRTTLEFYKGNSPNGNRTDWVMQEYSISDNFSSSVKGGSSLCRVFLSDDEQGETKPNDDVKGQINLLHDEDCKPLKSKLHEEMERYQAMITHQGENPFHADCFEEGDFLEILDLDPNSSSSSSRNSSCLTPSSDLFFDSVALLHELEDEVSHTKPSSSYKFSVTRPISDALVTVAPEVKVEGSNDAGASSSRQMPGGDKRRKVKRGKTIKTFFCFMAF